MRFPVLRACKWVCIPVSHGISSHKIRVPRKPALLGMAKGEAGTESPRIKGVHVENRPLKTGERKRSGMMAQTRAMVRSSFLFCILGLLLFTGPAQSNGRPWVDIRGQVSLFGNYSPDSDREVLLGGRYIPEISRFFDIAGGRFLDFEASANLFGTAAFHPFASSRSGGDLETYRFWGRYGGDQFELRAGLQKINFGPASILRPLMWFDHIDPRDPLQLTDGVWALLGRYYFLNNANIWLWALYGNDDPRGWDLFPSRDDRPELGGRCQYPVPRGEMAVSAHYRTADASAVMDSDRYDEVDEFRLGLDGKWDVLVGLWFETAWIHRDEDLDGLTSRTMVTLGWDYTFGAGNGLNLVMEHLATAFDADDFGFSDPRHVTAATLSYPFTLSDRVNTVFSHDWDQNKTALFLNYEHQFRGFTGHIMAFYNPDHGDARRSDDFDFTGPGIRILFVYDH